VENVKQEKEKRERWKKHIVKREMEKYSHFESCY
jgi:hypothetical protein